MLTERELHEAFRKTKEFVDIQCYYSLTKVYKNKGRMEQIDAFRNMVSQYSSKYNEYFNLFKSKIANESQV